MNSRPAAGLRVQLLMAREGNRALVADLLGVDACSAAPESPGVVGSVDMFVADAPGLAQHRDHLETCRRQAYPKALPCLLLLAPRSPELPEALWQLVDDVVRAPVRRQELALRLEALARTRRLSLALAEQTAEVSRKFEQLSDMHARLHGSHEALKRVSQQKSQLLGMAAHDLRNPLSVVHQYLGLLREPEAHGDDTERDEIAQVAQDTTAYMLALVDDMLDDVRAEAGRLDLDLRVHDMAQLVRASVGLNRIVGRRKDIEIHWAEAEGDMTAVVDGPKIRQVVDNLLGNAIKYSRPGTCIHVRLDRADALFKLSVQDHGPGIGAEQLASIFEPFRRGQARQGGTGLGLSIARRIAQGHGGQLLAQSHLGRGSTFTLVLPEGRLPVPGGSVTDEDARTVATDPVLVEEDRLRLLAWRDQDPVTFNRALDDLLAGLPEAMADVYRAADSGQFGQLERSAYRIGWQVRRFSGSAFEAAMQLESAAREHSQALRETAIRALSAELRRLHADLQPYGEGAVPDWPAVPIP